MAHPNISSELLRTFISVVESGGFTRAAEQLHKTQSTVSQQMQRLEAEVGTPLFSSLGRKRILTREGEMMLSYARRLLSLQDDAISALNSHQQQGELRIGISPSLVDGTLPQLLASFSKACPGIALDAQTDYSSALQQGFDQGQYDLILGLTLNPTTNSGEILRTETMRWIGPAGYQPLPGQQLPLASLSAPCLFRHSAIDSLNQAGIPWRQLYTTTSNTSLMAAVSHGLAITARPRSAARYDAQPLDTDWLPALPNIHILLRSRQQSTVAQTLVAQLQENSTGMF